MAKSLNINKKTGDSFSAAEVNAIVKAVDKNTEDIETLQNKKPSEKVDASDHNPVSSAAVAGALQTEREKSDKTYVKQEVGKVLSSNDYTDEDKQKLSGLQNYDDTQIKQDIENANTAATNANGKADGLETRVTKLEEGGGSINVDTSVIEGSQNPVCGGAVFNEINKNSVSKTHGKYIKEFYVQGVDKTHVVYVNYLTAKEGVYAFNVFDNNIQIARYNKSVAEEIIVINDKNVIISAVIDWEAIKSDNVPSSQDLIPLNKNVFSGTCNPRTASFIRDKYISKNLNTHYVLGGYVEGKYTVTPSGIFDLKGTLRVFEYNSGGYYVFKGPQKIDFSQFTEDYITAYFLRKNGDGMKFINEEDILYSTNFSDILPDDAIILATYDRANQNLYMPFIEKYEISKVLSQITQIADVNNKISKTLSKFSTFSEKTKIIDFTIPNKYWNIVDGTAGLVGGVSGYYSHEELIPVEGGDILRIYGTKGTVSAAAYAAYDSEMKPFNGKKARIDHAAENKKNGCVQFVIPAGCTQVGLFVSPVGKVADCYITINEEAAIGDVILSQIENIIDSKIQKPANNKVADNSAYYLKGSAPKTFTKKLCILCGGQSNAEGRNTIEEATPSAQSIIDSLPFANCHVNFKNPVGEFVQADKDSLLASAYGTKVYAFDMFTYNQICKVNNKELYVIKEAVGGTSIDMGVVEAGGAEMNMYWTADYEEVERAGKTSLLRSLEKKILACKAADNTFDIRAMLWHQGEGDRLVADKYYDNLSHLIAYIRGVVGDKNLPFVTGTISHNSQSFSKEIEDAQKRIAAEDANFYLIDMSGAKMRDSWHFDAEGSEYFGLMVFDALVDAKVIEAERVNPVRPW